MRDNATDTIDAEIKSRLSVADEAMGLLRGTFLAATQVANITFPKMVVAQPLPSERQGSALRRWGGSVCLHTRGTSSAAASGLAQSSM